MFILILFLIIIRFIYIVLKDSVLCAELLISTMQLATESF